MNNKIKLAVAGAVLSAASVANAGIIIPAGEWTLDVNGNVNVFATFHDITKNNGEVTLFVDPNQLSFVTVNLIKPRKEVF